MFDDRNVSPENQKKLWEHYYNTLSKGIDVGFNPKLEMNDPELANSLKYDIAKFSAFKETSFRKQLEAALTANGKVAPWSEFKKTADALNVDYNRRWLKTEYDHTVATANMAQQWKGFVADADLYPNLKYVTAGDARVRDEHKILDGTILPIDHLFWKTHCTPLDWGCRCNIEQTNDKQSEKIPDFKVKKAFQNNPYYSGKVFNESPYTLGLGKDEFDDAEKFGKDNFESKNNFDILSKNQDFKNNLKIIKDNKLDKIYPNIEIEKINSVYTYTSNSYEEINKFNRTGNFVEDIKKGRTKEYYQTLTKTINNTLDEIPDKFQGLTYRGTDLDKATFKKYKDAFESGKPISDKGFTSTSYDQKEGFGGTHKFKIVSKNGTIVDKISANGVDAAKLDGINEKEVLFKAGQEFKVSYILETEPGKYEIFMEQI